MNDVSDGFKIFNGLDDKFPFSQTRNCNLFHIITFFTNFVDVRLIVGLLVGFALGRFWFEVVISRLHGHHCISGGYWRHVARPGHWEGTAYLVQKSVSKIREPVAFSL